VTTTSVAVAVLPVNFPPVIVGATFTLAENALPGATVGNTGATTSDPNTRTPSFYLGTWSILSQEPTVASPARGSGGATTAGGAPQPFAINAATGSLTVNGVVNLDFEVKSLFRLLVQVTDNGGLRSNATFFVQLANVNEAPYWVLPLPALFALPALTLPPTAPRA
jgi:hypothetical protein